MLNDQDIKEPLSVEGAAVTSDVNKSEPPGANYTLGVGSSTLYLDPKKEASMMRKFDVGCIECVIFVARVNYLLSACSNRSLRCSVHASKLRSLQHW